MINAPMSTLLKPPPDPRERRLRALPPARRSSSPRFSRAECAPLGSASRVPCEIFPYFDCRNVSSARSVFSVDRISTWHWHSVPFLPKYKAPLQRARLSPSAALAHLPSTMATLGGILMRVEAVRAAAHPSQGQSALHLCAACGVGGGGTLWFTTAERLQKEHRESSSPYAPLPAHLPAHLHGSQPRSRWASSSFSISTASCSSGCLTIRSCRCSTATHR